jgi:hypothetical protein
MMKYLVHSKVCAATVALFLTLVFAGRGVAETVTLAWDPNPVAENVTGYILYYGSTSRFDAGFVDYDFELNVQNVTEYPVEIPDLAVDCYFAVVAYTGSFASGLRSDYSDEVVKTASVFTVTSSAGVGGTIAPEGAVEVIYGGSQTYSISPDPGHHVADVEVDGASVGAVTSHTLSNVTADHTITAVFAINTHTVTASAGAGGAISPSGSVTVSHGGSQAFAITPQAGHHVVDVEVDEASVGAVTSHTLSNVTADHTITAVFAMNTHTVTASAGAGGAISPSGSVTVSHGGSQAFAITPQTGHHVVDVEVDGASVGAVTSHTLSNVTADHAITASFAPDPTAPSKPQGMRIRTSAL